MDNNPFDMENQDLIQRYLADDMEGSELQEFFWRLEQDAVLQSELAWFRNLNLLLENEQFVEIDQKVDRVTKDLALTPDLKGLTAIVAEAPLKSLSTKGWTMKKWWLCTAGIAGLALIGFLLFNNERPIESSSTQIEEFIHPLTYRENFSSGTFAEGLTAYKEKDYNRAIDSLTLYLSKNQVPLATLYLGSSYLLTNNNELAINELQKLVDIEEKAFAIPAQWNLALAYIRNNQANEAIPILEKLMDNPVYAPMVSKLLAQINL